MQALGTKGSERPQSVYDWEETIRNEITYYSSCLEEILVSDDLEYKALTPIYESLLAHRRKQLERFTASRGAA